VFSGFQSAWSGALAAFVFQRGGTIGMRLCIESTDTGSDRHCGGRCSVDPDGEPGRRA
jgi:hypothetical protein